METPLSHTLTNEFVRGQRSLGSQPKEAGHRPPIYLNRLGGDHFPEADLLRLLARTVESYSGA